MRLAKKVTGSFRTVKLLKITLYVLFIWVNYLISSPFMVLGFQQGWDLPSAMSEDPCLQSFTHASERNESEGRVEGKLRHEVLQKSDSRTCRINIQCPFNIDSDYTYLF